MFPKQAAVRVLLRSELDPTSFPAVVEVSMSTLNGNEVLLVDKAPVFGISTPASDREGWLRCTIIETNEDVSTVDISVPDGVASCDGSTVFTVRSDQLAIDDGVGNAALGWPHAFRDREVDAIRKLLNTVFIDSNDRYPVEILDSFAAHEGHRFVAVTTSMHDLLFALPPATPPMDVLIVRARGSLVEPRAGEARIERLDANGHSTVVHCAPGDAVRVFWRFMREAFGIEPTSV